jgi:hypothetical protein
MIKIEFPADRTDIAAAIGRALLDLGGASALNTECPGDCGANSQQIADLDAAAAVTVTGEQFTTEQVADLAERVNADNIAIGPRPGSVFADPTETILALGKDLDATGADNGTLPQVDGEGVAFHAAFCGISAKPFYETGKTSGQWKKRRNVDQAAYDAWYAEQLAALGAAASVDTAPVDTAGAFPTTDTPPTEPAHTHAPTTCGDFMGWASKKQAAELLTQDDITTAYATAGLVITDLFPPNGDAVIAERVAVLYNALVAKAGA